MTNEPFSIEKSINPSIISRHQCSVSVAFLIHNAPFLVQVPTKNQFVGSGETVLALPLRNLDYQPVLLPFRKTSTRP